MPITIYPGSMKKRNANGSYSDLVPAIATDPEVLDDFAEEYSTSETYNIGDYCIHNSDLYKCNTNNTTGSWNNSAWDRVSVADELVDHKNTLNSKADKSDLASLNLTGTTNTTGSQIDAGTYFYLNGALVKAKTNIASGATFTSGTNYETVTAGGLNEFNNSISTLIKKSTIVVTTDTDGDAPLMSMPAGRVFVSAVPNRTYGDGTYSSWLGVIIGCGANSNVVSVKCVNDSNQKLASQKVAIDLYYIDGQQLS